jgi:CelD/BcsL family acetyltransferase involved in cellulose biosynthesis
MSLSIKIISDLDEFANLKQPWNELAVASEADHAFMRHEWFECWIRNLGDPRAFCIPTLWADGQMVGAAPMRVVRQKIKNIPLNVLMFMSSTISPRCNFLVHPSADSGKLFEAVFGLRGWDIYRIENLETRLSITRDFIGFLDANRKKYESEPGRQSPYQIVNGNWDAYLEGLSKGHRKNIRAALKKIESAESHVVEEYDTFEALEQVFDQMVSISRASWKRETASDLDSNPRIRDFYRDFSKAGTPDGLWRAFFLKINGRYVAFDYVLRHNRRLTGIRSDYDMEFKNYMPGHLLKIAVFQNLCSLSEPWEYDMGGTAVDYKLHYANEIREHIIVTGGSGRPFGSLIMFGKMHIWPLVGKFRGHGVSESEADVPAQ